MPVNANDLDTHRAILFKFAMLQLRNQAQAEDVVQETLIAAIQGAESFAGQSSVRTWLVGILKHKIIDVIRKSSREQPLDPGETRPRSTTSMPCSRKTAIIRTCRATGATPKRPYRSADSSRSSRNAWKGFRKRLRVFS